MSHTVDAGLPPMRRRSKRLPIPERPFGLSEVILTQRRNFMK